ncbi:hypothetical protein [Mycobacterium kansasii]|uniref:hypothetical protein n=1 Tax=Mycobacterium kansasii TaxID=1768 RepID=UPI0009EF7549|nr:hypothetical protein [Mycobacterium kansasii]ARG91398.1 hypothetical protein B1T50_04600 [Mycobacterium kansasii]POY12447.1 hypothetical protein C3472_25050 [Mycobacterium kansasii]
MAKGGVRAKLDKKIIERRLKQSDTLKKRLEAQAKRMARKANATLKQKQSYPDYGWAVSEKEGEPRAVVFTRSNHAKYSNAKHQTLAKLR